MFLNLKGTFLLVSQKEKSGRRFSTFAKATADKGKREMGFGEEGKTLLKSFSLILRRQDGADFGSAGCIVEIPLQARAKFSARSR